MLPEGRDEIPLPLLGVPPALVFFGFSVSLVYQFFVHTERVDKLWRPVELVLNTPSHHRVHHGTDPEYLDRNYGGILIVWDRLFGTFQREEEPVVYGLTKNIHTYDPLRIATHEYRDIVRDVAGSTSCGWVGCTTPRTSDVSTCSSRWNRSLACRAREKKSVSCQPQALRSASTAARDSLGVRDQQATVIQ